MSLFTEQVEYELKNSFTALSANHYHIIQQLLKERKLLVKTLIDIHINYDCDNDAHKYNTTCRKCLAKETLEQIGE